MPVLQRRPVSACAHRVCGGGGRYGGARPPLAQILRHTPASNCSMLNE
ncbi:hypothetical protein M8494_09055 [Serratia ureilytica]